MSCLTMLFPFLDLSRIRTWVSKLPFPPSLHASTSRFHTPQRGSGTSKKYNIQKHKQDTKANTRFLTRKKDSIPLASFSFWFSLCLAELLSGYLHPPYTHLPSPGLALQDGLCLKHPLHLRSLTKCTPLSMSASKATFSMKTCQPVQLKAFCPPLIILSCVKVLHAHVPSSLQGPEHAS